MAVQMHAEDVLPHINSENSLGGRVAANNFCLNFLSVLKVCADINGDAVTITLSLAGIQIGSATLNPNHPSITLGGSALGFKAEVTITIDFNQHTLSITGTVCAPFAGCKSGSTTIHL